jgi:hypothetical protein
LLLGCGACGQKSLSQEQMRETVEAEFRATVAFETAVAQAAERTVAAQATHTPPPAPTATLVPPTPRPVPTDTAPPPTPTPVPEPTQAPPTETPAPSDRIEEVIVITVTGAGGSGTCYAGLMIDGGGTDSTVTFWVNTHTEAHPFVLDDPDDDDDREEGDVNRYVLRPAAPISFADVLAIAIDKDDSGHCPDWLLTEVTVVLKLEDGSEVKLWFIGDCMQDPENALPAWLQEGKLGLFWPIENWCYQEV